MQYHSLYIILSILYIKNVSLQYIFYLIKAMKGIMQEFIIILVIFVQRCAQQSCSPPFTAVSNYNSSYCVKCDSTCATCFDDSLSGCASCIADFNLNQNISYCIPPDTKLIHTVQSSYKYYGFSRYGNWTQGTPTNCLYTTILQPDAGNGVKVSNYLGKHYGLRIVVSAWWLGPNYYDLDIDVYFPSTSTTYTIPIYFNTSQSTSNNSQYCANSQATNFDSGVFAGKSSTYVTITFRSHFSNETSFGIRQYVLIQYLCNTTYCATCNGSAWNDCLTCADSRRKVYGSGQCRCDPRKMTTYGYFKHPDIDYCVFPCPSKPTGQYYGNVDTQECVLQCPTNSSATYGVMFADDVSGQCVATCPSTITLGNQTKNLFHDVANRRCVTNCPTSAPYKYTLGANKTCLASCPTNYYKLDSTMTCSSTCPTNIAIPLYKDDYLGKCVDDCQGSDWWADTLTGKCTAVCSGTDYFQDNTTTRNRCTQVCPPPLYWGDKFTGKCIDHCYGGKFGDTFPTSLRQCVPLCSGGYYGVLTGNRSCVKTCPNETWGEGVTFTCALVTTNCDPNKYADNYTHLCVAKGACSLGQYSTDDGKKCVINCTSGTYANDATNHCETACPNTSYFADPGIPKCVTVCQTPDLYADTESGNKCVASCNQTNFAQYRDFSTRKCVTNCNAALDLFSDPDTLYCVYNCSLGLYRDQLSIPTNKRCVSNCVSPNWGDNSTGFGLCVSRCPQNPPLFGDVIDGFRICVQICTNGFGDQSPTGNRQCLPTCPTGYFAQNDTLRRCVTRCNSTTYGHNKVCYFAEDCPVGKVGDPTTNLCTNWCSQQNSLFADDIVTNLCVQRCPVNNSVIYFADPTNRWCVDTCDSAANLFGNNDTQTCEPQCLDYQSYADAVHPNRYCIELCTNDLTPVTLYYKDNYTKTCVTSMGCPVNYFGDNNTHSCVKNCTLDNNVIQWGHTPSKTCVAQCYGSWGDNTNGLFLCVTVCPALPMRWSYDPPNLCVAVCPASDNLWGEDYTRTCTNSCPMHPNISLKYTYAYNITRRCLQNCPDGYFSDKTKKMCWDDPINCSYGWGDPYNNSCTTMCTGPEPWNSFGDSITHRCTIRCSPTTYADNYTGTRRCVSVCPGSYDAIGVVNGSYDSFGDNNTQSCVLNCVSPFTWADWQTHRCESRCSGDNSSTEVPTYSEDVNGRCVIALWCPQVPDKLFGDNNTRSCKTECYYNSSYTQWADNITRTCIPQCLNYSSVALVTTINWNGIDTRFYGDLSTDSPICVVICPSVPRLFGQNATNRCVSQCPDNQYGDQTGNRSCVPYCPIFTFANGSVQTIWFTQITQHICVTYCENDTWGNVHGRPACEVVPTDCIEGEYADNSTHLCVPLCPQSQNYFGDPSTRLCVDRCPTLFVNATNYTANINMSAGYLYADYSTRLCVYRCPDDFGPYGTFGDNFTNTCVQRCPPGSYGDWQTQNRYCIEVCTAGTYADTLSMTCVSECPSSPPYFGQSTNWTCVKNCPNGTWASAATRTCVPTCPIGQFRLTDERTQCVDTCPSMPDLYADSQTNNCILSCENATTKRYADPIHRVCTDDCSPRYEYNFRCVEYCPNGYYANSTNNCVRANQCDGDLFADNRTTKCISPCVGGAFADPNSKYCIAICPQTWYGSGTECVQNCTGGFSSSNITQVCTSNCPNYTYHENSTCKAKCQYGYANDVLGTCADSCPSGKYADPLTHDCVSNCFDNQTDPTQNYFRNLNTGFCVFNCSPQFKDFITGNCVDNCSAGYWGNRANHTCIEECIPGQYGYQGANQRTCYAPADLPGYAETLFGDLFGDPLSGQYVTECSVAPELYFGDRLLKQCKLTCQNHSGTAYYGDPASRQCQSVCTVPNFYTADPLTNRCVVRCSLNTFRYNSTPICVSICPVGFADNTTGVCVDICPYWADTFGYHNMTSGQRICVLQCPQNYYAENIYRTCNLTCVSPYFAYNGTHQCVTHCIDSFADPHTRRCMDVCTASPGHPNADNSTNECVYRCPSSPDYYADNHVCVFYCTNQTEFADPDTRSCVDRCPNLTNYNTYGDPTNGRCVQNCPLGYFEDNTTNKCVPVCPANSYGYNGTRQCLRDCPASEGLYADSSTHMCAYTCSNGTFGSQLSQKCVITCDPDYWGNPLDTMCVTTCPSTIYSYGENGTRTCVSSCVNHSGFADNMTRICRQFCQNLSNWRTFADTTTMSCVQMCPFGYYMENSTNECLTDCLTGFADNYSRFCVQTCPDDPQSYGDTNIDVCLYQCLNGQFSDNSTNLCVPQCPSTPDYFGDTTNGRCVFFCTEGLWAQTSSRLCVANCTGSQYADNLTRRCVPDCPPSQATYADDSTNRCVRVCPTGTWADNSTQDCVPFCPDITINGNSVDTYADNVTHFCVLTCPESYFGRKDNNKCVSQCPSTPNLFGHPDGRICVAVTNCYAWNGSVYYADDTTRLCVQKCPLNRWADTSLFKCVPGCPPGQFRNNNNQKCVTNCPSDPDQYADPLSQNCTRTCPSGSYAVVNSTGFRVCVTDCTLYGLIKENATNRCVNLTDCPTSPFMFGDSNAGACVYYCTNSYFADNKTRTCVYTCPSQWQLFGSLATYQCVQLCQNYKFADELYSARPRTCRSTCSNGYFADNQTSRCVQRCSSIKPFYYQDIPSGSCVQTCPGESYAYNSNQTCIYSTSTGTGYVSNCPGSYFADRISKSCVTLCPYGSYATTSSKYCQQTCVDLQFADNQTRTCTTTCSPHYFSLDVNTSNQVCVQFCPSPYYAQNSSKSCVLGCSSLLALNATRSCQNYCPQPYFAYWSLKLCVLNCAPKFADIQSRTCITPCITPSYSNPLTYSCDLICPVNYFGRNTTRSCSLTCLSGSFADPHSRICVEKCPVNPLMFADDRDNTCVPICASPRYGFTLNRTCIPSCPNISGTIYLADRYSRRCVLECVDQVDHYADYANNVCTDFCPNGTFASNDTKDCVSVCPNIPNDTFSHNTTRMCLDVCPLGTYGYSATLNCVDECWLPLFGDPTTSKCVLFCPDGYFAQNQTATCRTTCQPGTYADPTTHRCVADCPESHDLYKFTNWTCLASCPPGYYANRNISQCVQICNSMLGMYAYDQTNACVMQCPYPYRGFDPNHTCILSCPALYFYNKTRNVCTRCPAQCTACIDPYTCQSCIPAYNLFNGICSSSCQPSGTLITYAHPTTNMCVTNCPVNYFGNNATYSCVSVCLNKLYGNTTTGLCQNCPATCAICVNLTYCTSCQANATMAIDHMCYSQCSASQPYYYGSICYSVCPSGTYVSFNGVTCVACSDLCASCSNNASYCLTCIGRYYYNHNCLTQCPTGYYGASDFTCQACTTSTASICSQPLNFSTTVSIQNYQYVVAIKFNQEVSIQAQIQNLIRVQLKVSRRLLGLSDLINSGVTYTYTILSDGTIKLYLNLDTDLINPVFTVKFTDPTAIVSLVNGGSLQDVANDFTIQKVQYYPPEATTNLGIKKVALFTVVFILLLFCISILFTDTMIKPLQMLQIMFFHCIITAPMSASLFFFLVQLKPSLLQFLPNWLAIPLAKDLTLHQTSSQRTIDVFTDYNFFKNVGQFIFVVVIMFGLWGLFMILSNKRVIQNKTWHKFFEMISIRRFRFSLLNDFLGIFYVPILWFGFNQFQQLFSAGYLGFNGFICLVLVILAVLYPFSLFYIWWKKQTEQISQRFPFMLNRIQKTKQKGMLQVPITYIYLLFTIIWLVGLDKQPKPQSILLILTNAFYIGYLIISRPFSIHINTIFSIVWCLMLIVVEIFILLFTFNDLTMSSTQKTAVTYPMLITISVIMILVIIWSVWRCVWQFIQIWKTFKQTDFYKQYGDPEVQVESQKSQVYEKYQKIVVNNEPVVGDILIDKVYKQCNDKGENVIKVRKKVLKKKKKVRGRGKKPANEEEQQQKQFIRINNVNPFDYDYDKDFKPQQKKQTMKRTFDDDLRQIMSDEQDKPVRKNKNLHEKGKEKENNKQKQIFVEKEQKIMKNLGDIFQQSEDNENIRNKKQEQEQYKQDFEYIEDKQKQDDINKGQQEQRRKDQFEFDYQQSEQKSQKPFQQFELEQDKKQQIEPNYKQKDQQNEEQEDQEYKQSDLHNILNQQQSQKQEQPSQVKKEENQQKNKIVHQKPMDMWQNFDLDDPKIQQADIQLQKQRQLQRQQQQKQKDKNEKVQKAVIQNQSKQQKQVIKPKGIQQLLQQQQQSNKKKKLLFLFDEFQQD